MRHAVNFGLLYSFVTLAASGAAAFLLPFSLVNTRVHLVFGLATAVLVGLHLASRWRYFQGRLAPNRGRGVVARQQAPVAIAWAVLLASAIQGWRPAAWLVDQSYEHRHRASIVRASALAGFEDLPTGRRVVSRVGGEGADVGVSLLLTFPKTEAPPPTIAVWAESSTGTMIETLYLDPSLAYEESPAWGGRPTPRNRILPLWRNRYTAVSGVDPAGQIDSLTAATENHAYSLDAYLSIERGDSFVLCVEVNQPGDPNDAFPDGHIGQPSLLYTAFVDVAAAEPYVLLTLTGHGGGAETDGAIRYDLDGFGDARALVDLLLAKVEPLR